MRKKNTSGRVGRETLHPPRRAKGSWVKRMCAVAMAGVMTMGMFSTSLAAEEETTTSSDQIALEDTVAAQSEESLIEQAKSAETSDEYSENSESDALPEDSTSDEMNGVTQNEPDNSLVDPDRVPDVNLAPGKPGDNPLTPAPSAAPIPTDGEVNEVEEGEETPSNESIEETPFQSADVNKGGETAGPELDRTPAPVTQPDPDEPAEMPTDNAAEAPGPEWSYFYDESRDTYQLTFNIGANAEGDQFLDLTQALELLKSYAEAEMAAFEDQRATAWAELAQDEEYVAWTSTDEYKEWKADVEEIREILPCLGVDNVEQMSDDEVAACWTKFGGMAPKPDVPVTVQTKLDEINAMKPSQGANALGMQPGDVRKFEIFITSDSKHTYRYKLDSFELTTPVWTAHRDVTLSDVLGFDGQYIPEMDVQSTRYVLGFLSPPGQKLIELTGTGYKRGDGKWDQNSTESRKIRDYLLNTYKEYVDQSIIEEGGNKLIDACVEAYLLDYYSMDGEYADLQDLLRRNPTARTELSELSTHLNWKALSIDSHECNLGTIKDAAMYDNFYENLLSVIIGATDAGKFKKLLNSQTVADGRVEYKNGLDSWNKKQEWNAVVAYYMANKKLFEEEGERTGIWGETNEFFRDLLPHLTSEDIKSFMMAFNIDGELTGSEAGQDTLWSFMASLMLEQLDYDFTLTKTDEKGETIVDPTGFELYYLDAEEAGAKMYCIYDPDSDSYIFVPDTDPRDKTLWTTDGELHITYALLKNVVYYLQETIAPEGYERDPNVYVILSNEMMQQMSADDIAQLEADDTLVIQSSPQGLVVSTQLVNRKTPPTPSDEPTPTPTPSDEPTPTPTPSDEPTPTPTPSDEPTPTPSETPGIPENPPPDTPDVPPPDEPQSVNPVFPEPPQQQTLAEEPEWPEEPTETTLVPEPEPPTQETLAEDPEWPETPEELLLVAVPEFPQPEKTPAQPVPTVTVLRTRSVIRTTPVTRDQKSVPKTGDETMLSLWYFLTFAAVITILGTLFEARKEKKQND